MKTGVGVACTLTAFSVGRRHPDVGDSPEDAQAPNIDDDELPYAYFAANAGPEAHYDRRRYAAAYSCRAFASYRKHHVQRGVAMMLKAVGLSPNGRLNALLTRLGCWFIARQNRKLAVAA